MHRGLHPDHHPEHNEQHPGRERHEPGPYAGAFCEHPVPCAPDGERHPEGYQEPRADQVGNFLPHGA
jgi:hypothetical protein